jgi:hypothetical protein
MHFEATGDRERLTANADTIGAINLLFHVGDRFPVHLRPPKGLHLRVRQADRRGPPPDQLHARLDYAQSKSILDEKNLVTGQTKHLEAPVPAASPIC